VANRQRWHLTRDRVTVRPAWRYGCRGHRGACPRAAKRTAALVPPSRQRSAMIRSAVRWTFRA